MKRQTIRSALVRALARSARDVNLDAADARDLDAVARRWTPEASLELRGDGAVPMTAREVWAALPSLRSEVLKGRVWARAEYRGGHHLDAVACEIAALVRRSKCRGVRLHLVVHPRSRPVPRAHQRRGVNALSTGGRS